MRLGGSSMRGVAALVAVVSLTGACAAAGAKVSVREEASPVSAAGPPFSMSQIVSLLSSEQLDAAEEVSGVSPVVPRRPLEVSFDPVPGSIGVRPDARVAAAASGGRVVAVAVASSEGPVPGSAAGGIFTPVNHALDVGQTYTMSATVRSEAGIVTTHQSAFATLAAEFTMSADITPEEGDVVGVGRPVIVRFSDPVPEEDRARVQARFSVDSVPRVPGAWRWMSDSALHWRPLQYWPAHTAVWVAAATNGLAVGEQWFEGSTLRRFDVGDAHLLTVDAATHQMVAYENGVPVRQIPISAGSDRYPTASGIDLIMEKHDRFEMDSTSVGIFGAEAYNVTVDDAQRLTNSGTFVHAAPWNGSLGSANLSHGCINTSDEDAQWLMDFTLIGDPVEITNTEVQVAATNGWGDWNIPAAEWAQPIS